MSLLLELLDFTYPTQTNSEGNIYFKTADGSIVLVGFEHDEYGMLCIEFVREGKDEYKPAWDITGQGDAIKIFSTIVHIVKGYLKHFTPKAFYFTAEEKSRVKLYDRLANRFDGFMGYKRVTSGPHYDDLLDIIGHHAQAEVKGKVFYFEDPHAFD